MPERADITDDALLGGRLRLLQPRRGHRFGHDAVLLAAAVPAQGGEHAVDLGAGIGAAGLSLLARVAGARATLVEIDPALSALAAENIARNALPGRARALTLDVAAPAQDFAALGLPAGSADHVLMNPPFNDAAHQPSPDALRRQAHSGGAALLRNWVSAARRLLRRDGSLTLIWRAQGLPDVLRAMPDFAAVSVLPVQGKADRPAIRVIVRGRLYDRLADKDGVSILPALVLADSDGKPTAEAEAILREGRALGLAEASSSSAGGATPMPAQRPQSCRAAE
ncbi:MAG: tRNA1(Val) (adenine(37)-N6)-methyltransferase [Pseudorhodoplanes sp.]